MFALRSGRSLRFSAAWDDECLVYDRALGDLMVVPKAGRQVLELLARIGPLDAVELASNLARDLDEDPFDLAPEVDELLAHLEANGLIESFGVDCCGPVSA